MTSAALIVVVVAGSFAFADIVLIKALGIGVAIAVALDATVVRALLVPATMRLLGRWNWWMPARLERVVASRLPASDAEWRPRLDDPPSARCSSWPRSPRRPARAPILANPPAQEPVIVPPTAPPAVVADPIPVVLPRDDGAARPADRVVVLHGPPAGRRRRALRLRVRDLPCGARRLSRPRGRRTSRSPTRPATSSSTRSGSRSGRRWTIAGDDGVGFDLAISGFDPTRAGGRVGATAVARCRGMPARTVCTARAPARRRPPAIRGHSAWTCCCARDQASQPCTTSDGWIDFGPAGGSYYYSRTAHDGHGHPRSSTAERSASTGEAWFDHQWGDFIAVGGGGWDWFAVNLEDGTDLTLSLVRDADGSYPLVYGTLVEPDGTVRAPAAGRVHGRCHRPLDERGDGRRLPGGLAHRDPGRGPGDRPGARPLRTRSSTRAPRRASSTGKARRSSVPRVAPLPLAAKAMSSSRATRTRSRSREPGAQRAWLYGGRKHSVQGKTGPLTWSAWSSARISRARSSDQSGSGLAICTDVGSGSGARTLIA